jgi:signal transduction histidine kinase
MRTAKEVLLLTLSLKQPDDIVLVRQRTRQIMQLLGFRTLEQTQMTTAISEIARNACQYAGGGTVQYCVIQAPPQLLVYINDHGGGITHLSSILSGQYQSSTGLGLGIRGAKKLVEYFTIHSSPQKGTSVTLGITLPQKEFPGNLLARVTEELSRHRPKSASEEVQEQNKELLQTLDLLSKARDELEDRVKKRTEELLLSNESLGLEIERRKETEVFLRETSDHLCLALESANLGTWSWSIKKDNLILDSYSWQLLGIEGGLHDRTLKDFLNLLIIEDRDRVQHEILAMQEKTKSQMIAFRILWPDGTIRHLMLSGKVYFNEENTPIRIVGIYWDITQTKEAEEKIHAYRLQMNEAIRQSSLGEVATSLAHEINQPLASILAFSRGCINRLTNNFEITSEIFETLKVVAEQAERAGQIVHRIKSFVKKGQLFYETIDINLLVDEAIHLMQHDLEQYPALQLTFKKSRLRILIEVDKVQLQQVILNLARNAMEAMQGANTIQPKLLINVSQTPQKEIKVVVKDNGPGFAAGLSQRIFETYFTTKTQGTGLGLSICRSIIEAHGGQITATSLPTIGGSFEFIFPPKRINFE